MEATHWRGDGASYDASDITVLEGLEPVRIRPGMYIGSTGPTGLHHLIWEVVDNAVDEAMAGYCTRIDVTLLADGGCRVVDDGRGIPVDPHPQYPDQSAAEIVLTTLHAGGKFGGAGYKVSGGLHGVGVSVVNALSHPPGARDRPRGPAPRHGVHRRRPAQGAARASTGPVQGRAHRHHRHLLARPPIFEETEFRAQTVTERLQVMAFLNRGLEIRFADQRPGGEQEGDLQVQRRHRRLRQAPQRLQGVAVPQGGRLPGGRGRPGGRGGPAVEHRVPRVASSPSPTGSPPPRAACTRRASRRP